VDGLQSKITNFRFLVVLIMLFKSILTTLTPLGYDFVLYMTAVISNYATVSWSPSLVLMRYVYSLWLWLPIDHGNAIRALSTGASGLLLSMRPRFQLP
jgi:hypothetical protein